MNSLGLPQHLEGRSQQSERRDQSFDARI